NASFPLAYFLGSINVISLYGADEPSTIAVHGNLLTQFWPIEICFILYLFATMVVIYRGINRGLESISKIIVPTYYVVLFILAVYTCYHGNFMQSLAVLFDMTPNAPILTVLFAAMSFAL